MDTKSLLEALKEILRLVVSTVIGYLLMEGVVDSLVVIYGGKLDPTQKTLITGLLMSIVRAIDRYIHVNPKLDSKGFLPQ